MSSADINMRRCTLLPVTDSVGGAIGYKVFQNIEKTLSDSDWCEYKSNSDIINILDQYRNNLKSYLQNPKVIKNVAGRLNVGTILRVNLSSVVNGIEVNLDILGENGEDVFLSEKILLDTDEIDLITRTIKNWVSLFERNIPYDGKVIGILGDQITINLGKEENVKVGNDIIIKRTIRKKKHPLLKQIVEWETEVLAKGKIFSVSKSQALGMIKIYTRDKKLKSGDWVVVDKQSGDFISKVKYPDVQANKFGKLGLASITFDLNNSSTKSTVSATNNEAAGFTVGFNLMAEVWITREYFGLIEVGRRFGTQSPEEGSLSKSEYDLTSSKLKFLAGYKYLPLGYFYGPQIDFYAGYGTYNYAHDASAADGFGDYTFSGYTVGARANVPLHKEFRAIVKVEMLMFGDFEDNTSVTGNESSMSSLEIELGVRYQYNPLLTIDVFFERLSNKATFGGSVTEVNFQDSIFKIGTSMKF
jgi:hypothetical protein